MHQSKLFSILTILLPLWSIGNNNDSILAEIQKTQGEARLELLEEQAYSVVSPDDQFFWGDRLIEEGEAQALPFHVAMGLSYRALALSANGLEDSSISARYKAIELFQSIDREDKMARQLLSVGNSLSNLAFYDSAMVVYQRSKTLALGSGDSLAMIGAVINMSTVYHEQGNRESELELLIEALELSRSINDSSQIGTLLFNLAVFHLESDNTEKSQELVNEVMELYTAQNNLWGLASVYSLQAQQAFKEEEYDQSLALLDKAIENYRQLGERSRVAFVMLNQGEVLGKIGRWEDAIGILKSASEVFKEIGERRYESISLNDLANNYYRLDRLDLAIEAQREAIRISEEIGSLRNAGPWYLDLAELLEEQGKTAESNAALKKHIELKDSLFSMNRQEAIQEMEAKYENEKKQLEIENLEKAQALDRAQIERDTARSRLLLIGLGLALLILIAVSFAFVSKRRDNGIIKAQKQKVESQRDEISEQRLILQVKNNEILDSIEYAKRIQSAILPPNKMVKAHLENSFILYKPKDVVAGDFYWMETVGDNVLFAAADCTGHGVPGAMVSVICVNCLNRAVREFQLTDAGEVLNKVRELVIKEFEKSEEDVKDGMDISLCVLNKKTLQLNWAGAHNPLLVSSKQKSIPEVPDDRQRVQEIDGGYLIEIKADKQPIGKFEAASPFTSFKLQLSPGDIIYTYTDGYPDQFGGENGKKFKSGNFKKALAELSVLSMQEQSRRLDEIFEQWRGELEQVDDVCVIGVRV